MKDDDFETLTNSSVVPKSDIKSQERSSRRVRMNNTVVTIGICIRNCGASIERTAESIVKQDYPHESMQVIFVDDGSIDQTLSVIKKCAPRMGMKTRVCHSSWRGLGAARQSVVDKSEANLIIWVDCGLELSKDFVTKQVSYMEQNADVGIAKGRHGVSRETGLISKLEDIGDFAYFSKDTGNFQHGSRQTSKLPGTGGSVSRVTAIREVGGFDTRITGACEDTDIAYRIRKAGWLVCATDAVFYKRSRSTLMSFLRKYFRYGYGLHYILHKHPYKEIFPPHKMVPFAGFLEGLLLSHIAYRSLRDKAAFLLPLSFSLKRLALCWGFTQSHFESYGHT